MINSINNSDKPVAEPISVNQLIVRLAQTPEEIKSAQRLRYQIFFEDFGATPNPKDPNTLAKIDIDEYDEYCEHLIAIDTQSQKIVGTYRILTPTRARELGKWYSQSEFDISSLYSINDSMVEVGRSCVDKNYRGGGIIAKLWSGIVHYLLKGNYQYLIGCASIPLNMGEEEVAQIINITQTHLAPLNLQAKPHIQYIPYTLSQNTNIINSNDSRILLPPLLKGYLHAGAWVAGAPAYDAVFNTADVLVVLNINNVEKRYLKHFVHKQH